MIITEHYNHDDSLRQHELYSLYMPYTFNKGHLLIIFHSLFIFLSHLIPPPSAPLASDT